LPSSNKLSIKKRIDNLSRIYALWENTGTLLDNFEKTSLTTRTNKSIDWTKKGSGSLSQAKRTADINEMICNERLDMGDDERLPTRIRRFRNKSHVGDVTIRKNVNRGDMQKLELKNTQNSERIILTERLISRLGRSRSRSEKNVWNGLLRSNTERSLKRNQIVTETGETEENETRIFLTKTKYDFPMNKALTTRRGQEKRFHTEDGNMYIPNLDYFK